MAEIISILIRQCQYFQKSDVYQDLVHILLCCLIFTPVFAQSQNRILLELDGYYGFLNNDSVEVIAPQYDYARRFNSNRDVIGYYFHDDISDYKYYKYGVIDTNGLIIIEPEFLEIRDYSEGLVVAKRKNYLISDKKPWQFPFDLNSFWGKTVWCVFDYHGGLVFEAEIIAMGDYHEGMAWYKEQEITEDQPQYG